MQPRYDRAFTDWVRSRKLSARARKAVEFILDHGSVTSDDIAAMGQAQPPRTIGDIRDAGIKTAKKMVIVNGNRRAQYTLVPEISGEEQSNRKLIPKKFRDDVFTEHQYRCGVCNGNFTSRELQADHRIPFRIAGDGDDWVVSDFMPLCAADNRGKSWSCEHCENWSQRDPGMCATCFWSRPDGQYKHVAGQPIRRMDLSWTGAAEVKLYDKMAKAARINRMTPAEYVKKLVEQSDDL